ncbi:MAG: ATP-binding protein [Frankiaceae bacterium]|jgi:serine/threonine-protein kinase RsbW
MPVIDVQFSALPAHVRTARLVASAVARRAGVADRVLDEVRIAVGEACSRAVDLHQRYVPTEAVRMEISDDRGRLGVTVIDAAPGAADADRDGIGSGRYDPASIAESADLAAGERPLDCLPDGFGLAVIRALADEVDITPEPAGAGTRIRMSWAVDGVS